jgi:hypothetical protein
MEGSPTGRGLHGGVRTIEAIRRALQNSRESLRALSKRYGVNPKAVAKRKKRGSVADQPTGPKEPKSTVLSTEEDAVIVRRHILLPLDNCLYALQATPELARSIAARCVQVPIRWPQRSTLSMLSARLAKLFDSIAISVVSDALAAITRMPIPFPLWPWTSSGSVQPSEVKKRRSPP